MTHISRPFQIALAAVVLLAGVWFFALRSHGPSESSGSGSSASAPAASAPSSHSAQGSGSNANLGKTYHGSAPGVAGLSSAIAKAQGAVKRSEQNAKQLQQKAAQATGSNQAPQSQTQQGLTQQQGHAQTQQSQAQTPQTQSQVHRHSLSTTQTRQHAPTTSRGTTQAETHAKAAPPAHVPSALSKAPQQALVESELKRGRTVIVLFWNPKGTVDVAVRRQLSSLQGSMKRTAVHYSSAAEVGQYGAITRSLQVLQTPTMLVIDPNGSTKTLTGLVDTYAIRQAIAEAHAAH